jgi:hypothetical protein
MKNTSLAPVLLRLFSVAVVAGSIACANTPSGPTAGPTPASTPAVGATSGVTSTDANAGVNLARCLGGGGDASCFSAGRVSATSVASSPVFTSGPIFNNNNPVLASGPTVTLTWTPAPGGVATSYLVEASTAPGQFPPNLLTLNTGNASTTLVVPGAPTGVYYVRIRAVDASGPSAPSNEVQVIVGVVGGSCPSAPQNLFVSSQSAGTISIAWQAPLTGAPTSYVIQAGSAPGLADLASFDTGSTALAFVAGGVPAGSYYVRVYGRSSSCSPPAFLGPSSNEVLAFVVGFSGDVQVSVSWDAPTDVDLHVVEPSGTEIYYGNRTSATGGQLDVDSNPACSIDGRQIENIRWPSGAPGGTYTVRVDYWDNCGVARTNFLVTVKNGPSTQTFAGFFTGPGDNGGFGDGRLITTFFHAASAVAAPAVNFFRAPELFTPSAQKLKVSAGKNH